MRFRNLIIFSLVFLFSISFSYAFKTSGTFQVGGYCGDGIITGNEECDADNLNSQTCITRGYDYGDLTCNQDCMFNESSCKTNIPITPAAGGGGGGGGGSNPQPQCRDKIDNDKDGKIDMLDPGCSNEFDDSEEDKSCYPSWYCYDWKPCINNTQERDCVDLNFCNKNYTKIQVQNCVSPVITPTPQEKCIFLFLPCWLWLLLLIILILAFLTYYYYKKKKEKLRKLIPKRKQAKKK